MADIEQEKELMTEPEETVETGSVSESEESVDAGSAAEPKVSPKAEPEQESIDPARMYDPLTEREFIREQMRLERLEWFNAHKTVLFAAIGVILAALIFLGIRFYNQSNNPASWLVQACAKDFGTSFDFEVVLSENDRASMMYKGTADFDRSTQSIEAVYDADYGAYTYSGALSAGKGKAVKGVFYKDKWIVEDCSEQVRDFVALDKSLKNGDLDCGALLRFLGMTSDYSSAELERFSDRFKALMSSDSTLATVSATSVEGGTRYTYEISVAELFDILIEHGAPLFLHSSDYNAFKARYEANARSLQNKTCKMVYVVDKKGYLSAFGIELEADDTVYRLDCSMSNFGVAEVKLPKGFLEAADLTGSE